MADVIQRLFIDPPLAIARLGGSDTPQEAYSWQESPNPRTVGETSMRPDWTLDLQPDGSVVPRLPTRITLRDGPLIRPVCAYFEVWALLGAAGSAPGSWRAVPLTAALMQANGTAPANLTVTLDARNRKAARRARNDALQFGTFPPLTLRGDDHGVARILAVSPPDATRPMIPRDRTIPLGTLQIVRPTVQPAAGSTLWADRVNVEVVRIRFMPATGEFYGPPQAAQPLDTGNGTRIAPVRSENAFLDARAGWFGSDAQSTAPDAPADTYDGADVGSGNSANASYGVIDDTCDARITVSLTLGGRTRSVLTATANVFVGPPDFAPDRRPFLSLADELNDRRGGGVARNAAMSPAERDAWVQDLFQRAYETVSLFNADHWRDVHAWRLSGARLRAQPIADDAVPQPTRALGGRDALRAPLTPIQAAGPEPLPITRHAQERHREVSSLDGLRDLVRAQPERLRQLIRAAFEVEPGEGPNNQSAEATSMRMPPFMRHSNAFPLTLSAWQYELLMAWADATAAQPGPIGGIPVPFADGPAATPLRALTPAADARRSAVLARNRPRRNG